MFLILLNGTFVKNGRLHVFLGRKEELNRLSRLRRLKKASLVVIKGRRRVGKSTLVQEFAKEKRVISLSGLPPAPGFSQQKQRDEFADQLCVQLGLPRVSFITWSDAFRFLSSQMGDEEIVVLFDEISWMGGLDPSFLGSLKTWWDQEASKKQGLILILCGSISTWIEKNILCSTGFVGRISLVIHLKPLPLQESVLFLRKKGFSGSIYEVLKILSVTGGIPWYLDLIDPKETADQNIYELCFESASQLKNEFQTIFHDLFERKGDVYRKILQTLVDGMKTQKEIREELNLEEGGTLSEYLKNLVGAGFVSDHYHWTFKKGALGKQNLYRLSDCFLRFQLKYVEPVRELIEQGSYKKAATGKLPGWDAVMGFQLESLLLSNREFLLHTLGVDPATVLRDNPYLQKATGRKKGCQIDYLIQTTMNSFIVCEFKLSKNELPSSLINELKEKCDNLSIPRGFGKVPALFHIGGVSPKIEESPLLYRVVDLRNFLEPED
ncbi:MAG: AAA family ATPase [Chlamydiales bacterium]|nr:AAA family ATPase [Chlamydiales bacterium]